MSTLDDEPDAVQRRITLTQEGEWWVALDEEIDVASQGKTRAAALANLDEAVALHKGEIGEPIEDDEAFSARSASTLLRSKNPQRPRRGKRTTSSFRWGLLRPISPAVTLVRPSRTGSHVVFGKEVDGEDNRRVTVPLQDRIPIGTLRSIARQAGANDFESFCRWIDENR